MTTIETRFDVFIVATLLIFCLWMGGTFAILGNIDRSLQKIAGLLELQENVRSN